MEAILVNSVHRSLRNFMFRNAIFVCERLCAEFPSEMNLQLLAGCYLQNNQAYAAYHILKGAQMDQSRYLFALACFQVDLLSEAEAALSPTNESGLEVPNGAAGHYLLGLVYRYTNRNRSAVHHFRQALSLDPLFWVAYEELCILGSAEEAAVAFGEAAVLAIEKQQLQVTCQHPFTCNEDHKQVSEDSLEDANPRHLETIHRNSVQDASGSYQRTVISSANINQPPDGTPCSLSFYTTPSPTASQLSAIAPPPVLRNVHPNPSPTSSESSPKSPLQGPRKKFKVEEKMQKGFTMRSLNLDSQATITQSSSSDARSSEHDGRGRAMSLSRNVQDDARVHNSASEILDLWRLFGEGYRLSCMYKCQDALDIYQNLPPEHYNTGWVLSQVGKAYFELVDYLEADRAFSLARRLCPYRLDGMDVYSTVLFHLKEDVKLSYLAQELLSTDRLAPQTWCAMGNCYSLQKDHDTAVKIFQRAVRLNSRFAYAHTLCGHEHVALEDFENGIRSFQSALNADSRHYNAWYGLGMVYLRQEKFEFAEHHFRMAFQINPHSSVIMSYLGTALHSLKRNEEALMMMEKAILADKKNPLPKFQKAIILASMDNYDEALDVLEKLKEYAPRECSIYALMGKIYKRKNTYDMAMLNLGHALDLKPSAADVATIKAAVETLHVPDDLDESLVL